MSAQATTLAPDSTGKKRGPTIPEEKRIAALDGVRGIAILLVFLFHTRPASGISSACNVWNTLCSPLWCGVDLFFVLSGFLITGILLSTKNHSKYFLNFYARRTLRIFPLYYGVLVALFVILPLLAMLPGLPLQKVLSGGYYRQLWNNQAWLWFYLQNFLQAKGRHQLPGLGHFWSLAIEEQFYLIWPFLVYALSERGMLRLSLLIFCCGLPLRWVMLNHGFDAWEIRHLTFSRIDTLAAGACLAILVRNFPQSVLRRIAIVLAIVSSVGLALLVGLVPNVSTNAPAVTVWGYTLLALLFSSVLLAISQEMLPNLIMRLISHRVLIFFGTLSYGIYVFHWPIVHCVRAVFDRVPVSSFAGFPLLLHITEWVVTLSLTVSVAILSWWLYESQILRLKRFFRYADS